MWRSAIAFVLLFGLVFSHDYVRPDECPDDHISYDRSPGQEGKTFLVNSEDDCAAECDGDERCIAYNIERRTALSCELNEDRAGKYGEFLNTGLGWEYYEKQDDEREYESCVGVEDRTSFAGRLPNNTDGMQKEILDSGNQTLIVQRGNLLCWFGKDTKLDDGRVYYSIANWNLLTHLVEYESIEHFVNDSVGVTHTITPNGISSQYLVWNRVLWYRAYDERDVAVFDLESDTLITKITETYAYKWFYGPLSTECQMTNTQYSGLDIEADESGVWFIFGMPNWRCYTVIVKIDTVRYQFTEFYKVLPWSFSECGTTFIADSVYYCLNSHVDKPTYIRYQYNIRNDTFVMRSRLDSGKIWQIPIASAALANVISQTHYNPIDGKLYATISGYHYTYEPTVQYIFNYN